MNKKIKVLFLSASPKDKTPVSWGLEHDRIQKAIKRGKYHAQFSSFASFTTAPTDFRELLTDYKPDVVHFCGHGDRHEGLIFQNARGFSQPINDRALAEIFSRNRSVRLVFLNACYSAKQAAVLSTTVDFIIGSTAAILDDRATDFASRVYEELANGNLINKAFRAGRAETAAQHLARITILQTRNGVSSAQPLVSRYLEEMYKSDKRAAAILRRKTS